MKIRFIVLMIMMLSLFTVTNVIAQTTIENISTTCLMPLIEDEIEGETINCGYISVPENWDKDNTRYIEVHYAVLKSRSDNPEPDPVVYLHGGPGGVALWRLRNSAEGFSIARETRDIVIFNYRGVGFSTPLTCDLTTRSSDYDLDYLERVFQLEDIENHFYVPDRVANLLCSLGLTQNGLDLDGYNSYQNGRDTVALMEALGYEAFNIHGGSYGTRLGLTIAREYPENIRSLTLDGTVQPWLTTRETLGATHYEQFVMVFELCRADATCDAMYPDLEARFNRLVEQLNEAPIESDDLFQPLTGDRLLQVLVSDMLNRRYAPRIITELEQGDLTTFLAGRNRELLNPARSPFNVDPFLNPPFYEQDSDVSVILSFLGDALIGGDNAIQLGANAALYNLVYRAEPTWSQENLIIWLETYHRDGTDIIDLVQALTDDDLHTLYLNTASHFYTFNNTYSIVVECAEDADTVEDVLAYYDRADIPLIFRMSAEEITQALNTSLERCAGWGLSPLPPRTFEVFETDIPILFLQGGSDSSTSAVWAREAHADLSGSYYVEFPELGHVVIFDPVDNCPQLVFQDFIDDPNSEPATDCVRPLEFVSPDEPLP